MNESFFRHFRIVTVIHVSLLVLLVVATFIQGCSIFHRDGEELKPFTVDVIPTQDGADGVPAEPVLPEPEPEPVPEPEAAPAMALEPAKVPEKPKQTPAKVPDKPKTIPVKAPDRPRKTPVQVSTTKVVRVTSKGPIKHYNPMSAKEIQRLLDLGAERSTVTSIPGEDQRQKLLVKRVLDEHWVPPSKADAGNAVTVVRLWFGDGGRITKWKIERQSSVPMLDDSVTRLLESVREVPGLSQAFINQYRLRGFTAEFKVAD